MSRKTVWIAISLTMALIMMVTACTPAVPTAIIETVVVEKEGETTIVVATAAAPAVTAAPEDSRKVLRMVSGASDLPTIDPSLATDINNIQVIDETTVGLTRQNTQTAALEKGMATDWTVSDDGLVYTFTIRTDVPWVRYDAGSDQVVKVADCEGADRLVTAFDFEYGILRTLNPATASDYAYVPAQVIAGAAAYNGGETDDPASVGVKALDDSTLQITFLQPAVYNTNIAGLWFNHAMPKWIIEGDDCTEGRGERWTETGFFQGYGPFVLKEWIHDAHLTLVKNPFWPGTENIPVSKIDELTWRVLDASGALAEYEAGNLETVAVPGSDFDRIMADPTLKEQVIYTSTLGTEFYSFNTQLAPTDDVRVRKALSMAIDRDAIVNNVVKSGKVAPFFVNPGVAGAPSVEAYPDLGVKYDPAGAKALLDEYLAEKGQTADQLEMVLLYNTAESWKRIAEAVQAMWKETLGIEVTIANQERAVFLQSRKAGNENIYRSSWVQDYPDANNFMADVFIGPVGGYFDVVDWQGSSYDAFLDLIHQAAIEQDPAKRIDLYAQAQQILVEDEAIVAPLYWYNSPVLHQPYVVAPVSITGYDWFETWDINK